MFDFIKCFFKEILFIGVPLIIAFILLCICIIDLFKNKITDARIVSSMMILLTYLYFMIKHIEKKINHIEKR